VRSGLIRRCYDAGEAGGAARSSVARVIPASAALFDAAHAGM